MSDFNPDRLFLFEGKAINTFHPFRCWDHPGGVPAADAGYADTDETLTVEAGGQARAYPVHVIASHHLVSDTLGGRELLITF